MIVAHHLNNSKSQRIPRLLDEPGLQVRPAHLAAVARGGAYALAE
jgi:hypothetical protein